MSKKQLKSKSIDPTPPLDSPLLLKSDSHPSQKPTRGTLKRALINGFIIFHLVAIISWAIPANSLHRTEINDRLSPYLLWSDLWQGWDIFYPNPRNINTYLEAENTLRKEQQLVWKFPRMEELGFVER